MIDIILHLDVHLLTWVKDYGIWIYGILFAIIFSETGFVVTPFLPGDSLLFVAGAIAANDALNVHLVVAVLILAAMAPATKRSESPGRNGVTTKPVSEKMIAKRIA